MAVRCAPLVALAVVAVGCRGGCAGKAAGGGFVADGGSVVGARIEARGAEAVPREGGTIRIHVEAEPPTLNPLVEHDAWTAWIALGAIYEPLVRQDPVGGNFSSALAETWQAADAQHLAFTLRAGVRWHDGRPLTVADVVFTFERLREPGASPDARADLGDLRAVEARGDREVRFTFERPAPLALQAIARVAILPAHHFAAGDLRGQPTSRAPIGTGPFRFVEWRAGERIVLAREPSYWGPRPHLDRVELRIVRDREAAFELLRRGELDLLWQLAPAQVDRALGDAQLAGARVVPFWLPRYAFVVWNERRPALGDRRVRQALTMLVDRERYLRVVYRGRARPVTGPYLPGSPSYDATIAPWPFDPAQARVLLDQAGVRDSDGDGVRELPGERAPWHVVFLLTAGSPTLEPLATLMQEDFRRAGVLLDIVPVEWAALLPRLRQHAFDASALMWNDVRPLQDNWPLFHSSQAEGGQNYGGWRSPDADRLLDALRAEPAGPARVALERALHRLVHVEQPYTFLGSPEVDSLVLSRVHGYSPDVFGPGFARLWVDDEERR